MRNQPTIILWTAFLVLLVAAEATSQPTQFSSGVCHEHRKQIGTSHDHSLADFYLPERESELARKAPEGTADGLCEVTEDGVSCNAPPHMRGLCRRHYRLATRRERATASRLAMRTR